MNPGPKLDDEQPEEGWVVFPYTVVGHGLGPTRREVDVGTCYPIALDAATTFNVARRDLLWTYRDPFAIKGVSSIPGPFSTPVFKTLDGFPLSADIAFVGAAICEGKLNGKVGVTCRGKMTITYTTLSQNPIDGGMLVFFRKPNPIKPTHRGLFIPELYGVNPADAASSDWAPAANERLDRVSDESDNVIDRLTRFAESVIGENRNLFKAKKKSKKGIERGRQIISLANKWLKTQASEMKGITDKLAADYHHLLELCSRCQTLDTLNTTILLFKALQRIAMQLAYETRSGPKVIDQLTSIADLWVSAVERERRVLVSSCLIGLAMGKANPGEWLDVLLGATD